MVFVFIFERVFYRLTEFLRHWYVKSLKIYSNFIIDRLNQMDRFFAWRITLKNFFKPLYGDYSIIGYAMGFVFRSLRLVIATIFYGFVFFIAVVLYLIWLVLPVYALWRVFTGT